MRYFPTNSKGTKNGVHASRGRESRASVS